jgi:hypothetical protein
VTISNGATTYYLYATGLASTTSGGGPIGSNAGGGSIAQNYIEYWGATMNSVGTVFSSGIITVTITCATARIMSSMSYLLQNVD